MTNESVESAVAQGGVSDTADARLGTVRLHWNDCIASQDIGLRRHRANARPERFSTSCRGALGRRADESVASAAQVELNQGAAQRTVKLFGSTCVQ
jgi:hypothetical protein